MKKILLLIYLLPALHVFAGDSISINEMKIELMQKEFDAQNDKLEENKKEIEILMQQHEDGMDSILAIYTAIFIGVLGLASWLLNWLGKREIRKIASDIANAQIQSELKIKLSKEVIDKKIIETGKPLIEQMISDASSIIDEAKQTITTKAKTFDIELKDAREKLKNINPNTSLSAEQKQAADAVEQKATEKIKEGDSTKAVIDFLYAKALKAYGINDWLTAINYFNDVIELDDRNENAVVRRAYAYTMVNHFNEAKKDYERTLELNKNNEIAHNNIGLLFYEQFKDYKNAKEHYEKAIEINPSYIDTYYNLAILLSEGLKEYENAKKHYEKAIELRPNDVQAHYNLACLLDINLLDYEGAKLHYEKSIELDPMDADAYTNLALLLKVHFNEQEKAKELYLKAIELDPLQKTPERDKILNI